MFNKYQLYRCAVGFSVAAAIFVLSSCSNHVAGLFSVIESASISAPSTSVAEDSKQETSVEEKSEYLNSIDNDGYQYVDFGEINWVKAIAVQLDDSILTKAGYCYQLLDDEDRRTYEEIYYTIISFRDECRLTTIDVDKVKQIFTYVTADHPELFWIAGYEIAHNSRNNKIISIDFSVRTTMDEETILQMQEKIANYVTTCLKGITNDLSDYEKVKYIYEYIISHTKYDLNAENNQNICSVFTENISVCQGFSVATQYLLQACGIESITVTGEAKNRGSHAWNLVKLAGNYYYLDTTWGSPSFSEETNISDNIIIYDYLCLDDIDMEVNHIPDNSIKLPKCKAEKFNYYVKENLLFNKWNQERFTQILESAMTEGKNYISIRFSNSSVRDISMDELINSYKFFSCLKTAAAKVGIEASEPVSYFENEQMHTVTFIWNKE